MRMYAPSPTVWAPEIPLHQLGDARGAVRTRRRAHTVHAGRVPVHLQGIGLAQGAVADISAVGSGAAKGAAFGPVGAAIGAGVGLVTALIGGLLAGHALRAKQARNENSAVNLGVNGFDSDLRHVLAAYQSGQIDANGAAQAAQVAMQGYWTVVVPQIQPNRNGCQSGASCPPDTSAQGKQPCTGDIGAACCVGCYQLSPSIDGPSGVLAAIAGQSQSAKGPYVAEIHIVAGSKYGATTRPAYTLDFTPPPASVQAKAALESALGGSGSISPVLILGALGLALMLGRQS